LPPRHSDIKSLSYIAVTKGLAAKGNKKGTNCGDGRSGRQREQKGNKLRRRTVWPLKGAQRNDDALEVHQTVGAVTGVWLQRDLFWSGGRDADTGWIIVVGTGPGCIKEEMEGTIYGIGKGTITVEAVAGDDINILQLKNVIHAPKMSANLLSSIILHDLGFEVSRIAMSSRNTILRWTWPQMHSPRHCQREGVGHCWGKWGQQGRGQHVCREAQSDVAFCAHCVLISGERIRR
jgi:hypothetical protein